MKKNNQTPQRLQKAMAGWGIASRRHAEELIRQGLVKVNGLKVDQPGLKVMPSDIIEVNGNTYVGEKEEKCFHYFLLHKPVGVITSVTDPRGRKTVMDILGKDIPRRIYPVGRLDYDTSGLLLLTNDGELAFRLTHPSYGVEKSYRVWINGSIPKEIIEVLENGVLLEDGLTSPAKIKRVKDYKKGNGPGVVEITIHEGKNRQVRRMFAKVGYPVERLQRIAFGPIKLDRNLRAGDYRYLEKSEVRSLKRVVGLEDLERDDENKNQ